jgi:hypothetical protein
MSRRLTRGASPAASRLRASNKTSHGLQAVRPSEPEESAALGVWLEALRTRGHRTTPMEEGITRDEAAPPLGIERRQSVVDRRSGIDRRSGLDRRRGPGRRRSEARRDAEEGELNSEQFDFVMAMDEYKRANKRPFPSWTEVLEVIKYLGYRRVAERGEHVDRPAPDVTPL